MWCDRKLYFSAGLAFVAISALTCASSRVLFDFLLKKTMTISPSSPMYRKWIDPHIEIKLRYFFFNVTNPEEVQNGAKAVLNEVGPYTFWKFTYKENIEFHDDGDSVEYDLRSRVFFHREESTGDITDVVTTLDPMVVVLANKLLDSPGMLHGPLSYILWGFDLSELFMRRTVEELLYSGYTDPIIQIISRVVSSEKLEDNKFGYTRGENGTVEAHLKVHTGLNGMESYQEIIEYNGSPNLDFWKTKECNQINGTDGKKFHPGITKENPPSIFMYQFCRSLRLQFMEETTRNGLRALKFGAPDTLFKIHPDNTCFCVDEYTCRDGIYNLSPCSSGAPAVVSGAHFYYGTERDQTAIEGLSPDADKHNVNVEIEPITGIVTRGFKRAQMNLPVRKTNFVSALKNVRDVIFPVLWIEETAELPPSMISMIRMGTSLWFQMMYGLSACILCVGLFLVHRATSNHQRLPKDKLGRYVTPKSNDYSDKYIDSKNNNL